MAVSNQAAGRLQSSLDDVHNAPAAPTSKAGSTDIIRVMLREQKRECATLHANPLFKEFRDKQRKTGRVGVGQDVPAPIIDDLEAEGQSRLIDVIKTAQAEREAPPAGVWASFGKPYACLGELEQLGREVSSLLPHLNRDDLHSSQQQHRPNMRSPNQPAQAAAAQAQANEAGAGAAGDNAAAGSTAATEAQGSSREQQEAKLLKHKTVMKFSTVDRLEASFPAAAVKQANARRKAAKARPNKFFNKPLADKDMTDSAGSYGHLQLPPKQLPSQDLVAHHQAAMDAAAAVAAAQADAAFSLHQNTASAMADAAGSRNSVFITQRATAGSVCEASATSSGQVRAAGPAVSEAGTGSSARSRSRSKSPGHRIAIMANADERNTIAAAAASRRSTRATMTAQRNTIMSTQGDTSEASEDPSVSSCTSGSGVTGSAVTDGDRQLVFKALTDLTLQQPGSANPVTGWHNEFVKTRHAGYTSLQATLWQRSQARASARSQLNGRTQLNASLMENLDAVRGKLAPGWIPGVTVESPYTSNKPHSTTAATGSEAPTAGTRSIKQSEVELLEHFYDALCSLVERQRLSDPLSLMVVHQVKSSLEGGTFLQPPLLQRVIDKIAEFVKSCGLVRFNRFALPLLSFIRKCVGVGQLELESMAQSAGILEVLFEYCGGENGVSSDAATAAAAAAAIGQPTAAKAGCRTSSDGYSSKSGAGAVAAQSAETITVEAARRNSRIGSETGSAAATTTAAVAVVPPVAIEAAAAAAAADIEHAVQSAPASQRAAAISSSTGGGRTVRVRVPGVAGHVEVGPLSPGGSAAGAGASGLSDAALAIPRLDLRQGMAGVTGTPDEPLPDLGDDGSGLPLSRRAKQLEGMRSWSGAGQSEQAAVCQVVEQQNGVDDSVIDV